MTQKKNNKRNLLFVISALIIIAGGVVWYFYQKPKSMKENSQRTDREVNEAGDQEVELEDNTDDNLYENQDLQFRFFVLEGYQKSSDSLASGKANSRLILSNETKKTQLIVYTNVAGIDPTLADFQYLMKKSGQGFVISQKKEGFVPDGDTEEAYFSVIADFGVSPASDKISGSKFLFIWNSNGSNHYLEDFESILKSVQEI